MTPKTIKKIRGFLNASEESYTSKTSALDLEQPVKHSTYLGKRVKRGLFQSSNGSKINADVNASYNIIRKMHPDCIDFKSVPWNKPYKVTPV